MITRRTFFSAATLIGVEAYGGEGRAKHGVSGEGIGEPYPGWLEVAPVERRQRQLVREGGRRDQAVIGKL